MYTLPQKKHNFSDAVCFFLEERSPLGSNEISTMFLVNDLSLTDIHDICTEKKVEPRWPHPGAVLQNGMPPWRVKPLPLIIMFREKQLHL